MYRLIEKTDKKDRPRSLFEPTAITLLLSDYTTRVSCERISRS
jgi:hypothetical protein